MFHDSILGMVGKQPVVHPHDLKTLLGDFGQPLLQAENGVQRARVVVYPVCDRQSKGCVLLLVDKLDPGLDLFIHNL